MLLNKYWLETKSRFIIGILFITGLCLFFVLGQPWILRQWALDEMLNPDAYNPPWVQVAKQDYAFFIWRFLYNYLLQLTWALFTVILALGGLPQEDEKGSALFTLSLPVTRTKLFFQRIAVGFSEAVLLALLPALLIPLFSSFIHLNYNVLIAFNHSLLFIMGGTVFYAIGTFINTIIKTETASFFLAIGLVIVFYFLFQPYAEGMEKPLLLQFIDLPGIMAGAAMPGLLSVSYVIPLCTCLAISSVLLGISYYIIRKRDF